MGYTEEAKINLAKAKQGDLHAAQLAQVYASLAIIEALDDVSSQLAYLSDVVESKK